MHMNGAPHLLDEDRAAYERLLDEALRTITHDGGGPASPNSGPRPSLPELRRLALGGSAAITAAAAAEYRHLLALREELSETTAARPTTGDDRSAAPDAGGLTTAVSQMTEATGAGVLAVLTVLAPLLAGTAALIFLLVGYGLRMLDPVPAPAQTLLTTGWVFAALAAAALLVAGLALLVTALRNKALFPVSPLPADPLHGEVRQAAEAWERALTERGILPFLRATLAEASARVPETRPAGEVESADRAPAVESDRMPHLGYGRPGFSSPSERGQGRPGSRPSYQSPQFGSPDFSGPEYDGPGHG
ncbi:MULTISPECIES: hypothetical protein [Streptomyces]|nr:MULTISPECIES: hypothetical protein [Streptomyces]WSU36764.1 hypothetical protein OG378_13740 [Streptomyces gougerotii]